LDFDSKAKALDSIVLMYEDRLRMMTPDAPKITYDVQDLFRYIDNLHDVSALVLDAKTRQYAPVDKDGLKAAIYEHLKNGAGGGSGNGGASKPAQKAQKPQQRQGQRGGGKR